MRIMSDTTREKVGRIVVGVDGSEAANAALHWAVRHAELTGDAIEAVIV
jgi:nucleotide-binding universal stress UspA family protein